MKGGEALQMNRPLTVVLALGGGLLGGLLTRYIGPPSAFAQNQAPVAKEIRAQSFTLVDSSNRSRIVLRDSDGREIWSAGEAQIRPLSQR
jgi:hypothetical protein